MQIGNSQEDERERLEKQLIKEMKAAQNVYRVASIEHTKLLEKYWDFLDHPDGAHALCRAAKKERVALASYHKAARAFADLILQGRLPVPPGDAES
jgi:hypothetical protein